MSQYSAAAVTTDMLTKLSREGRDRDTIPITLRSLVAEFSNISGAVYMHGGLPNPSLFPFRDLSFTVADGTRVQVKDAQALMHAQQYAVISPQGYAPLVDWARKQVQQLHCPPLPWDVVITPGSNGAIEAIFSLLLDRGDSFLMEEYSYPQVLEGTSYPRGYVPIPVPMDQNGIVPQQLNQILERLQSENSSRLPKLLYMVPVGQNPTGSSLTSQRKQEIYNICRKFDILIVEDDAYFYLQYPNGPEDCGGLSNLGCSFLRLDTDSRVIRLDTFAKFVAPGLRLGWATAAPQFIAKLQSWVMGILCGPSGLSQVMTTELLLHWGDDKLQQHVKEVQSFYARKAAVLQEAAEKELAGLASWQRPTAGMFMWIQLKEINDVSDIWEALKQERVAVVPGRIAHVNASQPAFKCPFVRVSFSTATDDELREGMARLRTVLERFHQQKRGNKS